MAVQDGCGLGSCKPQGKIGEFFNNQWTLVIILGLCNAFLQALSNGFPVVAFRSLELKFHLSSLQVGVLSSMYEIADCVFAIVLSYAIRNISRPLTMALGFLIAGAGGVVFTAPHFFSDPLEVGDFSSCRPPPEDPECDSYDGKAYAVLMIGYMMIGIGSIPTKVIPPVYFDSNTTRKNSEFLQSLWMSCGHVGLVISIIVGAELMKTHTDHDRDILTPDWFRYIYPSWVGAWWTGCIYAGSILMFLAILVLFLPNSLATLKERLSFTEKRKQMSREKGTITSIAEFEALENKDDFNPIGLQGLIQSIVILARNKVFILTCICLACDAWFIQSLAGFALRYIEMMYNVNKFQANRYAAGVFDWV